MAYNYDDFMKTATSAGMLNRFSADDLNAARANPEYGYSMLQMYQNRDKATTAEQRLLADETANQLRKSYGVTPGQAVPITGQGVAPALPAGTTTGGMATIGSTGLPGILQQMEARKAAVGGASAGGTAGSTGSVSFGAKNAGSGSTTTSSSKSKTTTVTGSGPSFDYDPEQDPRMAAYRKTYLREAERAREDTLAKAAAATGGIPSSYAVGAADQAGNYFTAQLTDKIPELYNDAYNQQLQEWENALAIYQIMGDATPQEYLTVLGIKKRKKKDSSGSSGGSTPRTPAADNPQDTPVTDQVVEPETPLTKAEKAKKIQEAALRNEITPNQAQALLKQL